MAWCFGEDASSPSLREGFTYDEIAAGRGGEPRSRIRQIVSPGNFKQIVRVDSGAEHCRSCNWTASLQRYSSPPRASPPATFPQSLPYLKALERLDRYQTVASANQVYDDEARKNLLDKINRMAEN